MVNSSSGIITILQREEKKNGNDFVINTVICAKGITGLHLKCIKRYYVHTSLDDADKTF